MFQNNSTDKKEKKQQYEHNKKPDQGIQTQKKDSSDYKPDLAHFDETTKLIDEIISDKPLDKNVVDNQEIEDTEFFEVLQEETPRGPSSTQEKKETPIQSEPNLENTKQPVATNISQPKNQQDKQLPSQKGKQQTNKKTTKPKEKKKFFSFFGTPRVKVKKKQPTPKQTKTQIQTVNQPPIVPGDHEIQQDEKRKELEKKKPKKKVGFFSKKQTQKQTTSTPPRPKTPVIPTPKQTKQPQQNEKYAPTTQSHQPTVTPPPPIMKERIDQDSPVDEDIRKVLLMTDELLGKLPEPVIEEFASSKDFELYQKVMHKYHIK